MKKIERELKSIGIKPLEKIAFREKANIAENVANRLADITNANLNYDAVLEKLLTANMYRARITNNIGKVNYFYKNKTIYFDKSLNLTKIDEKIIYECIHYIQDRREQNEKMQKMGLCVFEEYKVRGMALNEIGIKYLTNKMLNKSEKTKIFIILKLMLLITGEESFIESLLNNNNKFQDEFMEKTNTENLYYKIQKYMDTIFDLEQIIKRLVIEGKESRAPEIYLNKINMHKQTINAMFLELQWEIYSKYFSRKIELIKTLNEIKEYKKELFSFNLLLEIENEELKYTNFTTQKLEQLSKISEKIAKKDSNNSMVIFSESAFNKIIRSIRKLLFRPTDYETNKIK